MSDIDWRAVNNAVDGTPQILNRPEEKTAVIRRLQHRMLTPDDWHWSPKTATKLTCEQVASRILVTKGGGPPRPMATRSVERIAAALPPATRYVCPDCGEDMWVTDAGIVEPHPTRFADQCGASGLQARQGLAAIRPDLYPWISLGVEA